MAICANQGRMYMGTARQYMEKQCGCQQRRAVPPTQTVRTVGSCGCERSVPRECNGGRSNQERPLRRREDGCQPESMCVDLPLAMAYMNPQPYTGLVSCDVALARGSAFNNLYDPWNSGKHC